MPVFYLGVAMPHFSFEYSANLEGRVDLTEMARLIKRTALQTGYFEPGAVRVRGVRCETYAIADELPENSFIDLSLRLGSGRSESDRQLIGDAIFSVLTEFLAAQLAEPHFALSFEVREIHPRLTWKKNAMHPRLRDS